MQAIVVTRHGGSDVLEVQDQSTPTPDAGQVLVEVAASGVNFIDVYRREGIYPGEPPFGLGGECAGRVLAVGDGVTGFAPGDVVATAAAASGTHAEAALLDVAQTVAVPDGVQPDVAAAAMLQGMTAHYLTNSTYPVRSGENVLVHAGAGGTGQLLVQLAAAKGARVIATVGSAEKVDVARAAGAADVIRYDEFDDADGLAGAVRELVSGGVDVVYDGVGKSTFDASLGSLRPRGMLALFGAASGQVPPFDLQRLNRAGSLFVTRPTLFHYIDEPDELRWRAGDVFAGVADGSLRVAIGGRYALTDARQAYDDLEGRHTTGKLLIVP